MALANSHKFGFCLSVSLSACLSLSICLSVYLSIYLYLALLSLYLSLSLFQHSYFLSLSKIFLFQYLFPSTVSPLGRLGRVVNSFMSILRQKGFAKKSGTSIATCCLPATLNSSFYPIGNGKQEIIDLNFKFICYPIGGRVA